MIDTDQLDHYISQAIAPFLHNPAFAAHLQPMAMVSANHTANNETSDETTDGTVTPAAVGQSDSTQDQPAPTDAQKMQDSPSLSISIQATPLFGVLRMCGLYPPDIISIFASAWCEVRVAEWPPSRESYWRFLTEPREGVQVHRSVELYRVHL